MRLLALAALVLSAAAGATAAPRPVFVASSYGKVVLLSGTGRALRSLGRGESPDWAPDGRLAWSDGRSLFVDGRRITRGAAWVEDRAPAWSPDGRSLAFASNRAGDDQELYLVRPDGSGLRRLTRSPLDDGMPTWRPHGRRIVFVSARDGNWELYDLDVATGEQTRLTATPQDESLPRIAADGRYAFVVPLPGGGSRISIAAAQLRGRRVIQAGTAVDWRA